MATFFVAQSLGLTSTNVTQSDLKSTKFDEITPNNGHYVVQGHSRSPISISVPIESLCAIPYYLPPISHRFQVMVQYKSNFRLRVGYLFLTHYFSVISEKYHYESYITEN